MKKAEGTYRNPINKFRGFTSRTHAFSRTTYVEKNLFIFFHKFRGFKPLWQRAKMYFIPSAFCLLPSASCPLPFSISFIYNEPLTELKRGQFWEIKAVLEKGKLKAQSGKLLVDKAKSTQLVKPITQYPVKLKGKVAEELENKCTIKNVENNKHNFPIAKRSGMEAKSEITIKFSGALPQSQPAPNKKVEIQVTDQNGIVFTALLNAKSWRKAEATTTEFADWAGAISGKLGKTEKGFEIIDGGISIFEKKVKQEVTSVEVNTPALS